MAYGVDVFPDPPDDGVDYDEESYEDRAERMAAEAEREWEAKREWEVGAMTTNPEAWHDR